MALTRKSTQSQDAANDLPTAEAPFARCCAIRIALLPFRHRELSSVAWQGRHRKVQVSAQFLWAIEGAGSVPGTVRYKKHQSAGTI
jgi:hypothetical protein